MADLFEAMKIFCRVSESGGFSAAARDLDLAQSQVSRAVQVLEERLGTRLINRTTRRHVLTAEGEEYLKSCKSILKAVESADESVGRGAETLSGSLRVFAPVSMGKSLVLPRLYEFMDRHPEVEVHLLMDDRPWDLIEHGIDVSLRIGPIQEKMITSRVLGRARRVVVASPDYWARAGIPTHPSELTNHEAIIFRGPITVDSCEFFGGGTKVIAKFSGRLVTNSSDATHNALLMGRGFTIAPWWLVSSQIATGGLQMVLEDWEVRPSFEIIATYPESHGPPARVRRFVDWLVYSWTLDEQIRPD